jgi:hypothetical protein
MPDLRSPGSSPEGRSWTLLKQFYFPMQKLEMSANCNVYWGIRQRAFSGDILET